ncbi:hypothetical protein EJB05_28430, partial [Eragrostis curvula]
MARRSRERSRLLARAAHSPSSSPFLAAGAPPASSSLFYGFSRTNATAGGGGGLFSSSPAAAPRTPFFRSHGFEAGRYSFGGKHPAAAPPLSITFSSPREALVAMDIGHAHVHGGNDINKIRECQVDAGDDATPTKRKDVPFFDFLGVGVSS